AMSASSRRATVALVLSLLSRWLLGQSAPDSTTAQSTIDAATLVAERGARSLTDIFTSQAPGLLVVPASGVNGMGSRISLPAALGGLRPGRSEFGSRALAGQLRGRRQPQPRPPISARWVHALG